MTQSIRSSLVAAVAGGIVGAALTAAFILLAAPSLFAGKLVREAMLNDPQILVDTADALRDRQYEPTLAGIRPAIETPFASSWIGAEKPDVVLVEFYDYACPYCKASNPHLERLLKEDKGLRVVFRELPILGPQSVTSARLSLAASKAGRFKEFHDALWEAGRPSPEANAMAAKAAGIPAVPPEDPAIEAELKQNFQLAGQLGATGTPLFVVGNRVMNSAVGYDQLKSAVEAARRRS